MSTLLVTGGAGFIGSCFVGLAVEQGHRVIVLDKLTYAGHRSNLSHVPEDKCSLIVGDISNVMLVTELLKRHECTAIINFAAESHVDNSIHAPSAFMETNITGTYQLLQAALEYWRKLSTPAQGAFRFVQISTDEVYGSLGATGYFTEASPMQPNSPYSASKAASDHLCRAWHHTYGLPVVTTHCTNNYGPRQYPEKLIPHMITCALAGNKLPVYGDGMNVRDWIHVEDHCHGLLLALKKGAPGEVYNFGGRAEVNNISLVHKLCSLLDVRQPLGNQRSYTENIAYVQDRPGHDRRYAVDDSKAENELGFTRRYDFDRGLKETVDWYLSNQAWCDTVRKKAA